MFSKTMQNIDFDFFLLVYVQIICINSMAFFNCAYNSTFDQAYKPNNMQFTMFTLWLNILLIVYDIQTIQ